MLCVSTPRRIFGLKYPINSFIILEFIHRLRPFQRGRSLLRATHPWNEESDACQLLMGFGTRYNSFTFFCLTLSNRQFPSINRSHDTKWNSASVGVWTPFGMSRSSVNRLLIQPRIERFYYIQTPRNLIISFRIEECQENESWLENFAHCCLLGMHSGLCSKCFRRAKFSKLQLQTLSDYFALGKTLSAIFSWIYRSTMSSHACCGCPHVHLNTQLHYFFELSAFSSVGVTKKLPTETRQNKHLEMKLPCQGSHIKTSPLRKQVASLFSLIGK